MVRESVGGGPKAEKDPFFCKSYCSYYDATGTKGCAGKKKGE